MKIPKTILVTNKSNIRWLTGFAGTSGYVLLQSNAPRSAVVRACLLSTESACRLSGTHDTRRSSGFLLTDARYHLVAQKVLPKNFRLVDITGGFEQAWEKLISRNRIRKIGIEESDMTVRFLKYLKKKSGGVQFVDIKNHFEKERMIKRKDELAKIIHAQKITDEILFALRKLLKPGQSEKEIAWKIEMLAHELGAEDISFPAIVGINENSASPHHHPSEKRLKKGDLILIDMGVLYKGFCSDMTRVLFTKKPTTEQAAIYELVLRAQETAIQKLRAGITGKAVDTISRNIISKAGFGEKFGHSLGHGVGLDVHELPNLSQKYPGKIPAGAVVTVEPGVYLPGKFGVRLEDMVFVTKDGVQNLTKSPKTIEKIVINL